jgi:hypothetical protein
MGGSCPSPFPFLGHAVIPRGLKPLFSFALYAALKGRSFTLVQSVVGGVRASEIYGPSVKGPLFHGRAAGRGGGGASMIWGPALKGRSSTVVQSVVDGVRASQSYGRALKGGLCIRRVFSNHDVAVVQAAGPRGLKPPFSSRLNAALKGRSSTLVQSVVDGVRASEICGPSVKGPLFHGCAGGRGGGGASMIWGPALKGRSSTLVPAVVDDLKVSEIYGQQRDRCIERTCNVLGSAVEEPAFRPASGALPKGASAPAPGRAEIVRSRKSRRRRLAFARGPCERGSSRCSGDVGGSLQPLECDGW